MEKLIENTSKWNCNDLPVNTYFITETDSQHKGKIFLKTYGGNYVNILNGRETFDRLNLTDCVIINKLKISIEQM